VWHASVVHQSRSKDRMEALARKALKGVGDVTREWIEWTGYAVHIRRRLTEHEQKIFSIDAVRDLRGTKEAVDRLGHMWATLSPQHRQLALDELGMIRAPATLSLR
jgi:hypothetical protein